MGRDWGTMQRPKMRIVGAVLDSADPLGLAQFYERLIGWSIVERGGPRPGYPSGDAWAALRSRSGDFWVECQLEQHFTPPVWPGVEGKQLMMVHLDIAVSDMDAGLEWAAEGGGRLAEYQPRPEAHRVLLDPAGHPFCLFPNPELKGTARRPGMRVAGPVLDSGDPLGLAEFYERLLGRPIVERGGPRPGFPPEDGWALIRVSPPGDFNKIEFQFERYYAPPVWPAVEGKQQAMMRLDVEVDDLNAGVAWALEAGATAAEWQSPQHIRVLLDPAGHPFHLTTAGKSE